MSTPSDKLIPSPLNPTGTRGPEQQDSAVRRAALIEQREWLERLTENADFIRFCDFYKIGQSETKRQAEDIDRNSAKKRDAYAQRYFGIVGLIEWPGKQLAALNAELRKQDVGTV